MHEMNVAQSLLQMATQKAVEQNSGKVQKVSLSLGRFSGVEPQLLKNAFDLLIRDSCPEEFANKSKLEILIVPFVIHCHDCDLKHERDEIDLVCPGCGGICTEVISGQEILLTGLEIMV